MIDFDIENAKRIRKRNYVFSFVLLIVSIFLLLYSFLFSFIVLALSVTTLMSVYSLGERIREQESKEIKLLLDQYIQNGTKNKRQYRKNP